MVKLPELILLEDFNGIWEEYLDELYKIFKRDFIESKPSFPGKNVHLKRHPVIAGKEATFWHFISSGEKEEDRLPDLRRCERIAWPKPIIEGISSREIKSWCNKRNGHNRILIALEDFSFLVVLDDRGDYVLPLTMYCVEYAHRRKKYEKEFREYHKNSKCRPQQENGTVTPSTHGR